MTQPVLTISKLKSCRSYGIDLMLDTILVQKHACFRAGLVGHNPTCCQIPNDDLLSPYAGMQRRDVHIESTVTWVIEKIVSYELAKYG